MFVENPPAFIFKLLETRPYWFLRFFMSEKIIAMAFARLREAGKVSNIHWDDIVAHDPTGRPVCVAWRARKL